MKFYLPYTKQIDSLNPPDNLEEIVSYSFANYTKGTSRIFRYADKLLYLDCLIKRWIHGIEGREDKVVRDLILGYVEYNFDDQGELPSKEDFLDLDFMEQCVKAGEPGFYYDFERDHRDTETTQKCILRIIKTVVNWEDKDEA